MHVSGTVFFYLAVLAASNAAGQGGYDSTYGKPLIVLVEGNPWLMVIGSDVPSFAIYAGGQVIYKVIDENSVAFYEARLTRNELRDVLSSLVPSDDIYRVQHDIVASSKTDQPTITLLLDSAKRKIQVYGQLRRGSKDRAYVPAAFLLVYDNIKAYRDRLAYEWLPGKIEVMFWDYHNAPNTRPWIKNLPDLNSPAAIMRDSSSYSVFIDKTDFDAFRRYYRSMKAKEAVEISGRKMAISYRLPFPNIR